MSAVVGRRNVAATSAIALANQFGLEPLLGKTLAVLGDCRTGTLTTPPWCWIDSFESAVATRLRSTARARPSFMMSSCGPAS